MALTYDVVTINGVTRDAVVIEGTGDTAKVIFKKFLTPADQAVFDLIDASAGATFEEKFEAYTLPNGRKASDTFGTLIRTVGDFNYAARLTAASNVGAREIVQLQDELAACLLGVNEPDIPQQ